MCFYCDVSNVFCLSRLDHFLEQILSTKKFIEKVFLHIVECECVFVIVEINKDGEDDDDDVETIKSIYYLL